MNAYQMFAGEYQGTLVLGHFGHTAREVRDSIARMFRDDAGWAARARARDTDFWELARKEGWRVRPVMVQRRDEWLLRR